MAGATTVDMVVATAGTAYLLCPEARIPAVYASALATARDDNTAITNVFTGRPARSVVNRLMRELGPFRRRSWFPTAGGAIAPIRAKAETASRGDFTNHWSGKAARLAPRTGAEELTRELYRAALEVIDRRSQADFHTADSLEPRWTAYRLPFVPPDVLDHHVMRAVRARTKASIEAK
jgi:nitronate monooxygenase